MANAAKPANDTEWADLSEEYASGIWIKTVSEIPAVRAAMSDSMKKIGSSALRVLDIGCGAGMYSTVALDLGAAEVLGVDLAPQMVEEARRAAAEWKAARAETEGPAWSREGNGSTVKAEFVVGSVLDMSSKLPEGIGRDFDLAVCVYVLCNLESKEAVLAALREAAACLRPGGRLIIVDRHPVGFSSQKSPIFESQLPSDADGDYYAEGVPIAARLKVDTGKWIEFTNRRYTFGTWVELLGAAGFSLARLTEPNVPQEALRGMPEQMKRLAMHPISLLLVCEKR